MRWLTCRAFVGLLMFDLRGFDHNFASLHRFVCQSKPTTRPSDADTPERVCEAVNQACVWYPKRVLCLQRSAVTTCLLRRYGVSASMVVGVQKVPFKAHAWVEVDGRVVNDKPYTPEMYAVLDRC